MGAPHIFGLFRIWLPWRNTNSGSHNIALEKLQLRTALNEACLHLKVLPGIGQYIQYIVGNMIAREAHSQKGLYRWRRCTAAKNHIFVNQKSFHHFKALFGVSLTSFVFFQESRFESLGSSHPSGKGVVMLPSFLDWNVLHTQILDLFYGVRFQASSLSKQRSCWYIGLNQNCFV